MDNIQAVTRYDWVIIGQRIKQERERIGLSQQDLADRLAGEPYFATGVRQTISDWEKGKKKEIPLHTLVCLCNIFDCDMGYLLGEYDCHTRPVTDIHAYTGLSEESIETLHALITETDEKKKAAIQHVIPFINKLLEDRAAVQRIGANLNEIAFATDWEKNFGADLPDKVAFRSRNGGMFDLSRTIEQKADSLLGNPYASTEAGNRN